MYTYESKLIVYMNSFLEEVTKYKQNVTFKTPLASIAYGSGIIYLVFCQCLKNHSVRKEFIGVKICILFLCRYCAPKTSPIEVCLARFTRGVRRSQLIDLSDIPVLIILVRLKRRLNSLDKF
jgi:hypothetical protein